MHSSLLKKVNGKTLVIKDYTTRVVKCEEVRRGFESRLRDAYDGQYNNAYGTGERSGTVMFNMLCGVTSIIDDQYQDSALGQRFLCYRTDLVDSYTAAIMAGFSAANIAEGPKRGREMAEAAIGVMKHIESKPIPTVPEAFIPRIVKMAEIVAPMRAYVPPDRSPEIEKPMRVTRQLVRFLLGLARSAGKTTADENDLRILYKVTLDSTPEIRRRIFQLLATEKKKITHREITKTIPGFGSVVSDALKNLTQLKVVNTEAITHRGDRSCNASRSSVIPESRSRTCSAAGRWSTSPSPPATTASRGWSGRYAWSTKRYRT